MVFLQSEFQNNKSNVEKKKKTQKETKQNSLEPTKSTSEEKYRFFFRPIIKIIELHNALAYQSLCEHAVLVCQLHFDINESAVSVSFQVEWNCRNK